MDTYMPPLAPFMPYAQTYRVRRPAEKPDPYNPDATVETWDETTTRKITGFISLNSSTENEDGNRAGTTDTATFTIADPDADIQRGDMIIDAQGRKWLVQGHPSRDQSPFTGWHPSTVAQLAAWQG